MAFVVFDLDKGSPDFAQDLLLDGSTYTLRFRWSMRGGWYLGMSFGDEVLFHARRMTVDTDLLASHRHLAACPPGLLIALDSIGHPTRLRRPARGFSERRPRRAGVRYGR